jgi:hypothetical protein
MKFGRQWYDGVVEDHDVSTEDELIWGVAFDDGDECDLNLSEGVWVARLSIDSPREHHGLKDDQSFEIVCIRFKRSNRSKGAFLR